MIRFVSIAAVAALSSSAFAGLSVAPYAGGDAGFNVLTNNGALERGVTEGRTGLPGNWQMAIWQQGAVGIPQASAQFGLSNGAVQDIEIAWNGVNTISYTANGTTISWNQTAGSFTDIFIRVRSIDNTTIALGDLVLDAGGNGSLNIGNFSSTGAGAASYLRVQNDGQAIPAFTIRGTHQLSWTGQAPTGSNLAYQFKFTNVPTPGAMALVVGAGLVAGRRRR